jgi:hypothetical protein
MHVERNVGLGPCAHAGPSLVGVEGEWYDRQYLHRHALRLANVGEHTARLAQPIEVGDVLVVQDEVVRALRRRGLSIRRALGEQRASQ